MLQGLAIPEEYGGQGFTFIELGIVLEEMGRVLLCAPYFSSVVLAANAILNVGTDDQKQALLPGIASGDTIATLAFTEPSGKWDAAGITMEATESEAASFTLVGREDVRDRRLTADLIVVVARTRGHDRHRRHLVLHGRGRRRRSHPHAALDDGHDAQAGEARVRQRRGRAARQHRRRVRRVLARRSTRPRSRSPTR